MDAQLPWMAIIVPEYALLDIKYDGSSFDGVIDIARLKEELQGLEYCIRQAFLKYRRSDKKFAWIQDADLYILVEGFENNCFRERFRIQVIRRAINNLTPKEIAVSWIVVTLTVACVAGIYTVVKDLSEEDTKKISINDFTPEIVSKISDPIKIELLKDPQFRKEIAKIVAPLESDDDIAEIRTSDLAGEDSLLVIKNTDKWNFQRLAWSDKSETNSASCYEKREKLYWRINAIDLDATKRQIWFKIDGVWKEIDCSLLYQSDISNYKHLLGNWVYIEGVVGYEWVVATSVVIETISEAPSPLREAKNISIDL